MDQTIMTSRTARILAWGLVALTVSGFAGMILLESAGCQQLFNFSDPRPATAYGYIMIPLMTLGFSSFGGLIVTYHVENRIGWLAIAIGSLLSVGLALEAYGLCTYNGIIDLPAPLTMIWFSEFLTEGLFLVTGLFVMLFPTGKFLTPRWKKFSLIIILLTIPFTFVNIFWPGQLIRTVPNPAPEIQNPIALPIQPDPFWEAVVFQAPGTLQYIFILSAFIALFLRWHRSHGDVRQQIKWVAFFLMTSGTLFIVVEIIGATNYPEIFEGWFYLFELAIFWLGFPIVFGLSIFKYRLYDIDIIIRRTAQYAAVSAILVAIYFSSVILLQTIFTSVMDAQSPLIVVISTLFSAALFNPLRTRLQSFIDRRFFRNRYNAEQVLAAFARTTRNEVEMPSLQDELLLVVQETLQPETAVIWLKKTEKEDNR
jgi:two-component system NarL family sensor kinase